MIPTVPVTCIAHDAGGNPIAEAVFTFELVKLNDRGQVVKCTERYEGLVAPELVTATADADGVATANVFPNSLGTQGSMYRVAGVNPEDGYRFLYNLAVVPNSACDLHDILEAEPPPALTPNLYLQTIGAQTKTANSASATLTLENTGAGLALRVLGAATVSGVLTVASVVGALTGNASTATALQTARTINGVAFDGTANITVAAAAGTLTGAALAANVVSASLNAITPTGGTLAVAGIVSASSLAAGASGTLSALSPDGSSQLVLTQTNAGSMDLISYKGVGGGSLRFVSGDAGGNTVIGSWGLSGLAVTGSISATGNALIGPATNPNNARLAVTTNGGPAPVAIFNTGADSNIWMRPAAIAESSLTGPALSGLNDAVNALTDLTLQGANVNVVIENTLRGQWSGTGLVVTGSVSTTGNMNVGADLGVFGDINMGWDRQVHFGFDGNYYQTVNCAAGQRELQFLNSSNDTRADFVWMNSSTGAANVAERMRLGTGALSLAVRQAIVVNTASFALDVDNANAGGYGVRIRSAGVGGEPALAIENAAGSATVFMVQNNGGVSGLSGTFSYGLNLDNNTGVIHFKDTGGTQRRTILRASDQIIFGDVDNSTVDSYVTFCANLSQRHVINNTQIGVWGSAGLAVTGVLAASKAAGGAGLTLDASAGTADTGMDIRWLRGGVLKWQLGSGFASGGDNIDFYDRGGGDRLVWQAVSNGAFNIFVPVNVTTEMTVSGGLLKIVGAPTSASGLPAGTVWNDGGTLKIA